MRTPPQRLLIGFAGTTAALLACLGFLHMTDHPWLLPSLGGSCVILFGMPRGAMAQPRSFLGGHLLATATGLVFHAGHAAFGGNVEVWAAAAVGAALAGMAATRSIHSPAGANPIVVFAERADWTFLLAPLLPGLLVLFLVALALNNLPRPWGAGPWPRVLPRRGGLLAGASPRRRGVAASAPAPRPEEPRP
jgi:CBS-domain-containing membrane protein